MNHEALSPERIPDTFELEGLPEKGHAILETMRLERLPANGTEVVSQSVFQPAADCDGTHRSDVEDAVSDSYDRLDELLKKM